MFYKSEAIVLRTVRYSDSRVIVDMLTEVLGRLSFVVSLPQAKSSGGKQSKSKMKRQFFQPLTMVSIEFDYRQNNELQHLRDIRLSIAYSSLFYDYTKLQLAFFLSEFLVHATRRDIADNHLFSFVRNSLLFLDTTGEGYANFHIVFCLRLTRFLGVFPDTGDYEEGFIFDLRDGSFAPTPPLHTDYLNSADAHTFNTLIRLSFSTMHLFAASRSDRNRITDEIIRYYKLHIPSFPDLQALSVLRECGI